MSISSAAHTVPELHIFADAVSRLRDEIPYAGYGVYVPVHSIRVSEPLPSATQTVEKAEIHALVSALELIHGVRARVATVFLPSESVIDAYDNRLREWHANKWRNPNGRRVKHRSVWKDIWELCNVFMDRGVDVSLKYKAKGSAHNMRVATRLAKHGAALHVTCQMCQKIHGRQYSNHGCEPICDLDKCSGRVIKSVNAYMRHMRRRHEKKCRRKDCEQNFSTFLQEELDKHEKEVHGGKVFACEFCGEWFKSARKVKRHIETSCHEAPFCEDCGRLFKSKRELKLHNENKEDSDSYSSTSSDTDGGSGAVFGDTDGGVDEIGLDLARHDFGRNTFARHRHDDDSDSVSSSESSSDEPPRRRRHRHSHWHAHGHKHRHGHRHRRHRHHHHHHHKHGHHHHGGHSHGSSHSHGSGHERYAGGRRSGGKGLELARRDGMDWLVEEYERRRRALAQSDCE